MYRIAGILGQWQGRPDRLLQIQDEHIPLSGAYSCYGFALRIQNYPVFSIVPFADSLSWFINTFGGKSVYF